MNHIAYVHLYGFYTRSLESVESSRRIHPLIVHRDKVVIDLNRRAVESGLRMGMALTEAKSLCPDGQFHMWQEEEYRQFQTEWLDICTEFSDRIEPVEQHAAFFDLAGHPDPMDVVSKLKSLLQRKGFSLCCGLANTKWIAKNHALQHDAPFEGWAVSCLPVSTEVSRRLEFLGYRTVSQARALSLETLREQFGTEGLLVFQSVRGGVSQTVEPLYPPRAASSVYRFDGATSDEATLNQAIGALAKKLSNRLTEKDWQGSVVKLVIESEGGRTRVYHRTFSKSFQSFRSIFVSLKMTIGKLDFPVEAIRVNLPQLVEAPRFQMEAGMRIGVHCGEKLDQTFGQIRSVFGDKAIEKASEVREPRRKAVLRAWKDVAAWV